jgi:hypothetical protein
LFEIQADHLPSYQERRPVGPKSGAIIYGFFSPPVPATGTDQGPQTTTAPYGTGTAFAVAQYPAADLARCFLRLVNLPTFPLDRLSRYEATLWRQAGQIVFALNTLRRGTLHHKLHYGRLSTDADR